MDYHHYSSFCNSCGSKGYFKSPEKCTRNHTISCKTCSSTEYGKLEQCKGTNILMDYSCIAKQFAPFYKNGERIKVEFSHGEIKSGTVGMTTGWKPVFLLMLRKDSTGSSYTLSSKDKIIY